MPLPSTLGSQPAPAWGLHQPKLFNYHYHHIREMVASQYYGIPYLSFPTSVFLIMGGIQNVPHI